MNKLFGKIWFLIGSSMIILPACSDKESLQLIVSRDCTGTYLKQAEWDYKVCNPEKIAAYADGQNILVSFAISENCEDPSAFACKLYHPYKNWIFIQEILD